MIPPTAPKTDAPSGEPPLVSIIVPIYNSVAYLAQALESALGQTHARLEVIAVDDGSSDSPESVIERFQDDPRLRFLRQENAGPHAARNHGVSLAGGDYIAFLDADDWWLPEKLSKQLARFEGREGLGVVYSGRDWCDAEGRLYDTDQAPLRIVRRDRPVAELLLGNVVPMSTAVVSRGVLDAVGPFDESLPCASDWDYWLRASLHCWFDCVDERLAVHRKWGGQITANRLAQAECGMEIQRRFLEANPGAVDAGVLRKAWSKRYARRGRVRGALGDRLAAGRDLAKALWLSPGNGGAMADFGRLVLGRLREPVAPVR
ncbi:Chondroitin synthase [Pseudobythopirellula maris]|uniref:Chondroitin synthase n=1 Tax=Pseudobythopirellula maris TaxID=2527991 RepID=A0A5C5ZS20_9BACT|nr:glycosyltransferase family 2 protein [Pseudobythopirellula maris]TWT89737.1 Chondroitin synthase [Pseudobythopirellula maris]